MRRKRGKIPAIATQQQKNQALKIIACVERAFWLKWNFMFDVCQLNETSRARAVNLQRMEHERVFGFFFSRRNTK